MPNGNSLFMNEKRIWRNSMKLTEKPERAQFIEFSYK